MTNGFYRITTVPLVPCPFIPNVNTVICVYTSLFRHTSSYGISISLSVFGTENNQVSGKLGKLAAERST